MATSTTRSAPTTAAQIAELERLLAAERAKLVAEQAKLGLCAGVKKSVFVLA